MCFLHFLQHLMCFSLIKSIPPLHEIALIMKIIFIVNAISWSGGIDLISEKHNKC